MENLVGQRFGYLEVKEFSHKGEKDGKAYWKVFCHVCNTMKESPVKVNNLKKGIPTKTCSRKCSDNKPENAAIEKDGKIYTRNHRVKDIAGQRFGNLIVMSFAYTYSAQAHWNCQCICGKEVVARGNTLRQGGQKNCSLECYHKNGVTPHIGSRHNCLTVMSIDNEKTQKWGQYYYNVKCDCGKETSVPATRVLNGKVHSCSRGCYLISTKHKANVGLKFGRGTVKDYFINDADGSRVYYVLDCECGNEYNTASHAVLDGRTRSCGCLSKEYQATFDGSGNPNWKDGATSEAQSARTCKEYWEWQKAVFARDEFACQKCGFHNKHGNTLNAHHIKNFSDFKELRFEVDNGITYCRDCHIEFHSTYGRLNNTPEQVADFSSTNVNPDTLADTINIDG